MRGGVLPNNSTYAPAADALGAMEFASSGNRIIPSYWWYWWPLPGVYTDTQLVSWNGSGVVVNYTLVEGRYIAAFGSPPGKLHNVHV